MFGNNGTLWKTRPDGRLVELFENELDLFRSSTLRMHRQPPCRFQECQQEWYMSEGKNAYHSRQMVAKSAEGKDWKFPTSCPAHRDISKVQAILNRSQLCEKTGKRSFASKIDADVFTLARTSNNGGPIQNSYECAHCGGFHLSSMSPEQKEERVKAASSPSAILSSGALNSVKPADQPASTDAQICQLFLEGKSTKEIGDKFGVHRLTVVKILRQHNLWTGKTGHPHHAKTPAPVTSITPSDTVESLDAEIERLKRKKEMLEQAKKLRVEMAGEHAFTISKEGEHATLPLTELESLIGLLMEFIDKRTPNHAAEAVAALTKGA